MKLNFGKRLVLFFHWLFSLAGCAIAVVYCVAPNTMWDAFELVYNQIGKRQTDIIGIACLAVYVILSIATVAILFSNREKREERSFIIVDSGETGRTRIAVSAVEQMIRQAVRGIDDIKTMKTSIRNLGDSISIDSDVVISESSHVPSVSSGIQRAVRSYIELNCGVTVKEIFVNVRAMEQVNEKKQRGKKAAEYSEPVKQAVPAQELTPVFTEETPAEEEKTEEPISLTMDPFEETQEDDMVVEEENKSSMDE